MSVDITGNRRLMMTVCILIMSGTGSMMTTALATAIPPIMVDFDISASTAQWLSSSYALAMAVMALTTTFLVRRFPTKRLYLSMVAVFMAGLVIDIVAQSFGLVLVGRLMQAGANGVIISMSQVILLSIYPRERHGTVLGWYGLSQSAPPIAAPAVAGMLTDFISWRAVFLIPLMFIAFVFIGALLTFGDVLETSEVKFDVLSFSLCSLAFVGLALASGNLTSGIGSPMFAIPSAVFVAAGFLFFMRQRRLGEPFLRLSLFRNTGFAVGTVSTMLFYIIMMSVTLILPMHFQAVLGYSAAVSGMFILPGAILSAVMSPLTGRYYDRHGMRVALVVLSSVLLTTNLAMFFVTADMPVWIPVALCAVRGLGLGMLMPLSCWGIDKIGAAYKPDATTLLTSFRMLAGAAGTSLVISLADWASENTALTGSDAAMYGVNVVFLALAIIAAVMLFIGLVLARGKIGTNECTDENSQ